MGVKGVAFDVGKLHEINCGGQFPFGLNQLPVIGEKAEITFMVAPPVWNSDQILSIFSSNMIHRYDQI